MSIISLKRSFKKNQVIYCSIDDKIIKCICLNKLLIIGKENYDEKFAFFHCDNVKIITIYDIHKKIIFKPIKVSIFKKTIKINDILNNLIKKDIHFFKTFIGVVIENNKLNGVTYNINCKGIFNNILYNNIEIKLSHDEKEFIIYNNNKKYIYSFRCSDQYCIIHFYKSSITYNIYNNYIIIHKYEKFLDQYIYCNKKDLKITKIIEHYAYFNNVRKYNEERNDNNEVISLKKYYKKKKIIKESVSDNTDPPFSKPLKNSCIKLINHLNVNIINYIKKINYLLEKERYIYNNLLFYYNLEMINSE